MISGLFPFIGVVAALLELTFPNEDGLNSAWASVSGLRESQVDYKSHLQDATVKVGQHGGFTQSTEAVVFDED